MGTGAQGTAEEVASPGEASSCPPSSSRTGPQKTAQGQGRSHLRLWSSRWSSRPSPGPAPPRCPLCHAGPPRQHCWSRFPDEGEQISPQLPHQPLRPQPRVAWDPPPSPRTWPAPRSSVVLQPLPSPCPPRSSVNTDERPWRSWQDTRPQLGSALNDVQIKAVTPVALPSRPCPSTALRCGAATGGPVCPDRCSSPHSSTVVRLLGCRGREQLCFLSEVPQHR